MRSGIPIYGEIFGAIFDIHSSPEALKFGKCLILWWIVLGVVKNVLSI